MNEKIDRSNYFIASPDDFIFKKKDEVLSPEQILSVVKALDDKGLLSKKELSHAGLVKKKVQVKRGNKIFEQERWVKAGEDEAKEKPKKGKAGAAPEPKKPKGLTIQGLNEPGDESVDVTKMSRDQYESVIGQLMKKGVL